MNDVRLGLVELLKKTAGQYLLWDQRYSDFKKLTFRRRRSNLFAPTVDGDNFKTFQQKILLG
jgi:hypothetical protein